MRPLFFSLLVLLAAPVFAQEQRTLVINPSASTLRWTGNKVTGSHHGTVRLKQGTVDVRGEEIAGGRFEIDMTSIVVEDLTDLKWNTKLREHLKSDDFFAVARFPTASFLIRSARRLAPKTSAEPNYEISGDLTLLGISQPLTFGVRIVAENGSTVARGTATVDRTRYNIRYGSGRFFENLGDKMIYDDFSVDLELRAKP